MSSAVHMELRSGALAQLNERSREIFRHIVNLYLSTGEPVGSRFLSRRLSINLSPASIRNVMQDLEELGLVYAPHVSAGRLPTELGLRFFVDALLEIGNLPQEEQVQIASQMRAASQDRPLEDGLGEAMHVLSGLTRSAGLVMTYKENFRLKQIEFVRLEPEQALLVLVSDHNVIENRILQIPRDLPSSVLGEASNYLNTRLKQRTLREIQQDLESEQKKESQELDLLTQKMVKAGLACWAGMGGDMQQLIVRGQANLLENLTALEELERIRSLFNDLETKKSVIDLLTRAEVGEGVRIFIGSENQLFSLSGSSMIAAPLQDEDHHIVGILGVIGPTRLNYARIIPMVKYTAHIIGQWVGER